MATYHKSIHLRSWGKYGMPPEGARGHLNVLGEIRKLREYAYQPGISYDVTLAHKQFEVFTDVLKEMGFVLSVTTINPNSGYKIESWFKSG